MFSWHTIFTLHRQKFWGKIVKFSHLRLPQTSVQPYTPPFLLTLFDFYFNLIHHLIAPWRVMSTGWRSFRHVSCVWGINLNSKRKALRGIRPICVTCAVRIAHWTSRSVTQWHVYISSTFTITKIRTRFYICECLLEQLQVIIYCSLQWDTTITNPTEGALTQLGSLRRLLRFLDVCKMRHSFANILWNACLNHPKISCLNSHDSEASYITKYGYSLTCPSMWRYNVYINKHLQPMERRLVARRQVCWLDAGKDV